MEIPLRYSVFFAGSHWKVDSSQGKPPPSFVFNGGVHLDPGIMVSPLWGRVPPAAPVPSPGCRTVRVPEPRSDTPGDLPAWARTRGDSQGRNTLLPSMQNAAAAGFPLETGGGATSSCPSHLRDFSGLQHIGVLKANRWKLGVLGAFLSQAQLSRCGTLLHKLQISLECDFAFATFFPNHVAIQMFLSEKDCSFPS